MAPTAAWRGSRRQKLVRTIEKREIPQKLVRTPEKMSAARRSRARSGGATWQQPTRPDH
jgi:hypothetical protein